MPKGISNAAQPESPRSGGVIVQGRLRNRQGAGARPSRKVVQVESPKARQAFEDFWALGIARTLPLLLSAYEKVATQHGAAAVPTLSYDTLSRWSMSFDWRRRCDARQRDHDVATYEAAKADQSIERAKDFRRVERILGRAEGLIELGEAPLPTYTEMARLIELKHKLSGNPLADAEASMRIRHDGEVKLVVEMFGEDDHGAGNRPELKEAAPAVDEDAHTADDAETQGRATETPEAHTP